MRAVVALAVGLAPVLASCGGPPTPSEQCETLVVALDAWRERCLMPPQIPQLLACGRAVEIRDPPGLPVCAAALEVIPCDAPLPEVCIGQIVQRAP